MRSAAWPGIVMTLVIIGLVLAFDQVVSGAVEWGETRVKATAMQAEAAWRCKALQIPGVRVDCLLRLNSAPPTAAARDVERRV